MPHPTFRQTLWVWVKIGLLSFGGPTGQIALMHRELVERRGWISDRRFLHALNYCMLLPGPEAQQLAIYTGWILHKTRGGIVAGALFVLPGALVMAAICTLYVLYGQMLWMESLFSGLRPAVMAIVAAAVLRLGRKALRHWFLWALALLSLGALQILPFPAIIGSALILGFAGQLMFPATFTRISGKDAGTDSESGPPEPVRELRQRPGLRSTLSTAARWTLVWLAPLIICLLVFGHGHVLSQAGMFFAKAALVTFGGAYAVLPYVAQQAVENHAWLEPEQMMDGLALAETTPGPLILVLQFVGFLAGWGSAGALSPWLLGFAVAALTVWVTFLPGFLFIFAGAPWVEHSSTNKRITTALTFVFAAVVGGMTNLALWFGWHTLVPADAPFDFIALGSAILFFCLLHFRKWDVLAIVGLGAALGCVRMFLG